MIFFTISLRRAGLWGIEYCIEWFRINCTGTTLIQTLLSRSYQEFLDFFVPTLSHYCYG